MLQENTMPKTRATQETIPCAFCKGKGTDPFNVLSSLSVCGACDGRGTRSVSVPHVRCAYCEGTGSYKTYRCAVCGGAGVTAPLADPTRICPECRGPCLRSLERFGLPELPRTRGRLGLKRTGSRRNDSRREHSTLEINLMPIPPRTAHSLISSLRGSSFRRICCDCRTQFARAITTLGQQSRDGLHPAMLSPARARTRAGRS